MFIYVSKAIKCINSLKNDLIHGTLHQSHINAMVYQIADNSIVCVG